MSDFETLLFDVEDEVATITLNRPDRMNAYNPAMAADLDSAWARCDEDDGIRAVILTGAGRAFCAGADLGGGGSTFDDRDNAARRAATHPRTAIDVRKPVIAAINGHAIGVGITMTMHCDLRLVAEDAKLSFAFVRRGVIPELASHLIVPRVVGLSNAADLLLTGRTFTGREAAEIGLASRALPADQVVPAAREIARDIAINTAPVSVAISKRLLWDSLSSTVTETEKRETPLFAWAGRQQDAKEGVTAFLEKRDPDWQLRPSEDMPDMERPPRT